MKTRHCSVCGSTRHDARTCDLRGNGAAVKVAHLLAFGQRVSGKRNPRNPGATARLKRKLDGADNREWHRKFAAAIRRRKAAGSPGYYAARHARRHGRTS